jgi:hypothetical protein
MSGKYALIIGNTEYDDSSLAQLTTPGKDAEDFAHILQDKDLCAFDEVKVLLNQSSSKVIEVIEEFFDQRKPDDLLVLYFSGHGIRDDFGSLYLAFKNTIHSRLRPTAIKSDYIREVMDQSRSKRQVLILDCCNSGAFPQGTKAELGGVMGMMTAFQGYGRYVLTASDATQFAWQGDQIIGETDNSLFTHFLVKGLEGEADNDSDGKISVDDLYNYTFEQISKVTPKQTPTKSATKQEGDIVLRQIMRIEDIKPVSLPIELVEAIEDSRTFVREGAVQQLEKLLNGKNLGLARSARESLERIEKEDDSRRVSQLATQALEANRQAEQMLEEERKVQEEAQNLAAQKAEKERLEQEKAESERKAKEEAERLLAQQKGEEERIAKAKVEAEQLAEKKAEVEREAREEAERKGREEAERLSKIKEEERIAQVKAEAELITIEEAKRLAKIKEEERIAQVKDAPTKESKPAKPPLLSIGIAGAVIITICICGFAITLLFRSWIGIPSTEIPQAPLPTQPVLFTATYGLASTATIPPKPTDLPFSTATPPQDLPATPAPAYPATSVTGLPFVEDFTSNSNGWAETVISDEYGEITYTINGQYVWNVKATKPVNYKTWPENTQTVSDFILTVDAQRQSGPENSAYGVVFRLTDRDNCYYFAVSDVGKYYVGKRENGSWITLIDWTPSSSILSGQINKVRVDAVGNQFTFFINGDQVNSIRDDTFTNGFGGLSTELYNGGDSATFVFDNFVMDTP